MAFADTQELVVELNLKGNFKSALRSARSDFQAFDKATSRTQKSLGKFGSNIGKAVKVGAAAAAGGFLLLVNSASDFESAFAGVRKTVDGSEEQLQKLSDDFRKLSKEIPISAAELARLGEAGGALGIPIDQLEEFVRVTALLGVTTNLTADEAADSLGVITNILHLTGDEYSKFASALVALGNAGASTESDIIAIAERTGAAGELIGLTTEQVLGLSSAVASLGIEPEAGGTALQKFFIDTAKFVADGGEELELFAKISGTSSKQFKKNFDKDAGAALQRFLANLGKLDQGEQLRILEDLGFSESRITRTLLGLANNEKLVTDQMGVANKAFKDNTALTKEADQRFKTFASQLQITKNILTDMAITIGSKLLPKITPLLQRLNKFVNENQPAIEKFGTDLASGFEKVANAVGKVDWTPFIDGLKLSAELAQGAFNVFNALPDDFKKLILIGAGINKVTGGLITSLGKDIVGALGGQFLGRGSSPANPLWVTSVGGVGGVPGAGGGGGGILGKVGQIAATVALPVAIVSIAEPVKNELFPNLITPDKFLPPEPEGGAKPFWELLFPKNTVRVPDSSGTSSQMATAQNITNERLESIRMAAVAQNAKADALNASFAYVGTSQTAIKAAVDKLHADEQQLATKQNISNERLEAIRGTTLAAAHAGQQAAAAIRDKDLSVTVNNRVTVPVTIREFNKTFNTYKSIYKVAV